ATFTSHPRNGLGIIACGSAGTGRRLGFSDPGGPSNFGPPPPGVPAVSSSSSDLCPPSQLSSCVPSPRPHPTSGGGLSPGLAIVSPGGQGFGNTFNFHPSPLRTQRWCVP